MIVAALALLLGAAWAAGSAVVTGAGWTASDLRAWERAALTLTAGLGLTAHLLALLALAGGFRFATPVLLLLGGAGLVLLARMWRAPRRPAWPGLLPAVILATLVVMALPALAPVTEPDALGYVIPVAQRIAGTGTLAAWPDRAQAIWPQGQAMLLAWLTGAGSDRLGLLSAVELFLLAAAVSALARRLCVRPSGPALAVALVLASPVVAYLAASAKEDLLVLAAAAGACCCMARPAGSSAPAPAPGALAMAGVLAGVAAGAKYTGAGVVIAVAAWALASGGARRGRAVVTVALAAVLGGGLPYLLNAWRFGNPVAPFLLPSGAPLDAGVAAAFLDRFGTGRGLDDLLLSPARIFLVPARFAGLGNLPDPVLLVGVLAVAGASLRRRHAAALAVALFLYLQWFAGLQNARLLLPALVLLAPAAADVLSLPDRRAWREAAAGLAVVLLIVPAGIGARRAWLFATAPEAYLARELPHSADIAWMNASLDPARDRVASQFTALAPLRVPWLYLDPVYQYELPARDVGEPARLLEAARDHGITHLFATPDLVDALGGAVRVVRRNPVSTRGGANLFGPPVTEPTVVAEVLPPGRID